MNRDDAAQVRSKRRWRAALLLPLALLLSGCQVQMTGVFSTLAFNEAKHAMEGIEIFIVRAESAQYFAVIQCARGGAGKPEVVRAHVRADAIRLEAGQDPSNHCPKADFTGTVSATTLTGAFAGGPRLEVPRTNSYWQ